MRTIFTLILGLMISGAVLANPVDFVQNDPVVKEVSIYPNPTAGRLTLEIQSLNNGQNLTITVISIIGQEMMKQEVGIFNGNRKVNLDLNRLPRGIYLIEISNGKESITKRISKM